MLIGLLSDTHIPDHVKELPEQLKEVFHGVDLILHAGDIYTVSVLDELERLAPVLAAEGDDDPRSTASDRRVERKHILNLDGVTIWLAHDMVWFPPPVDSKAPPDVIVFGHTHQALLQNHDGALQINPGSATLPRYRLELGTVGLLTASSGKAEAQIIQLQ
ncbi:metallophosphoesterase family protein [Chloroflexota bacterium]